MARPKSKFSAPGPTLGLQRLPCSTDTHHGRDDAETVTTMTSTRWLLTALSFAATIGVSLYMVAGWSPAGTSLGLPLSAHLLALLCVAVEVTARALKIRWSARAAGMPLSFGTAIRTCLGGDFGAAITPARSGAEPARFFILAESGLASANVLVILYAELFLEVLSLAAVVLGVAIVFRHAGAVVMTLVGIVGAYAAVVLGIGVLALFLARRSTGGPPPRWAPHLRLHPGRWRTVQRALRKLRETVDSVERVNRGPAIWAFLASVMHVGVRLAVLPALVLTSIVAPLAPLALWPLGFLYGAAVVPAPGGGGAVEVAFRAALGGDIPPSLFAAALIWWRFYTFYIYILLGAIAAGGSVMRAVRRTEDYEIEVGERTVAA